MPTSGQRLLNDVVATSTCRDASLVSDVCSFDSSILKPRVRFANNERYVDSLNMVYLTTDHVHVLYMYMTKGCICTGIIRDTVLLSMISILITYLFDPSASSSARLYTIWDPASQLFMSAKADCPHSYFVPPALLMATKLKLTWYTDLLHIFMSTLVHTCTRTYLQSLNVYKDNKDVLSCPLGQFLWCGHSLASSPPDDSGGCSQHRALPRLKALWRTMLNVRIAICCSYVFIINWCLGQFLWFGHSLESSFLYDSSGWSQHRALPRLKALWRKMSNVYIANCCLYVCIINWCLGQSLRCGHFLFLLSSPRVESSGRSQHRALSRLEALWRNTLNVHIAICCSYVFIINWCIGQFLWFDHSLASSFLYDSSGWSQHRALSRLEALWRKTLNVHIAICCSYVFIINWCLDQFLWLGHSLVSSFLYDSSGWSQQRALSRLEALWRKKIKCTHRNQ